MPPGGFSPFGRCPRNRVRAISKSDTEFAVRLEALVERTQPMLLVIEDPIGTRFGTRHLRLLKRAAGLAKSRRLAVAHISRVAVHRLFASTGTTKHETALAIARQFPELAPRLPPRRTLWSSEDERMNIFDAFSIALAAAA
jgi:hypothetical protein